LVTDGVQPLMVSVTLSFKLLGKYGASINPSLAPPLASDETGFFGILNDTPDQDIATGEVKKADSDVTPNAPTTNNILITQNLDQAANPLLTENVA